jgi:diguanylate cyclase (GGDEF)-like protein/PAS domain S-box-containing protein
MVATRPANETAAQVVTHEAAWGAPDAYRALVEHIPAITYVKEPGDPSRTVYISPQVEELTGYPAAWFVANREAWVSISHPDDQPAMRAAAARADATGVPFSVEQRVFHRDGSERWVRNEAALSRHPDGTPRCWQGCILDITAQKQAMAALRDAEERYRTLIETIPVASYTYVVRDGATTRFMSPQIEAMLGYPVSAWDGGPEFRASIVHPDDRAYVAAEIERTDRTGEPYAVECRYLHRDGHIVWVRNEAVLVRRDADGADYWQGVISDITERKTLEAALAHQALHDALTDLPNRALLLDRAQQAIARARRDQRGVALLFLDLDNFKIVNDSLGHAAGDRLLVLVAGMLRACVRESDTVARLGGDEFVALLDGVADAAEAEAVCARIQEALGAPLKLGRARIGVTASIGVVISADGHTHPEHLLRDADIAMYRAKASGKQRHVVFAPQMRLAATQRWQQELDLRRAIERDELELHFQPKVELHSGRTVGVEALARWRHPERGLVPPADFIPLAEETGLIVPLGRWALREACRQTQLWNEGRLANDALTVSVNLSPRQFRDPRLAHDVSAALESSGLSPALLTIEITESVAMDDAELTAATLATLQRVGVSISIDDFGTGYSSLAHLKRFPVDTLKIDRSFVDGLGVEQEDTAIVSATIRLAHALGIKVIAEGVETPEQAEVLRELGCDRAQGFWFGRPVPFAELRNTSPRA